MLWWSLVEKECLVRVVCIWISKLKKIQYTNFSAVTIAIIAT